MTFEDVKKIRQNPTMDDVDNKRLSEMIDLAVEKQIPKKPIILGYREGREVNTISFTCPVCHKHIGRENYCKHCGQAILWESDI